VSVNLPNAGLYQQQLGTHCTRFRDALNDLLNDAEYINGNGGSALLVALGIDATDAEQIISTVGAVTPSNSIVQQLQAFIATTVFLWGGQ
jgi:hypothetical protein